jgi:hypothetical protein
MSVVRRNDCRGDTYLDNLVEGACTKLGRIDRFCGNDGSVSCLVTTDEVLRPLREAVYAEMGPGRAIIADSLLFPNLTRGRDSGAVQVLGVELGHYATKGFAHIRVGDGHSGGISSESDL